VVDEIVHAKVPTVSYLVWNLLDGLRAACPDHSLLSAIGSRPAHISTRAVSAFTRLTLGIPIKVHGSYSPLIHFFCFNNFGHAS